MNTLGQYVNNARSMVYVVTQPLRSGGFGDVMVGEAVGRGGRFPVAIKVTKRSSNAVRDFLAWHADQSIHLECIDHPNVVKSFDQFCTESGDLVLILERAEGSLAEVANAFAFTSLGICSVGIQVLSALQFLHEKNIIHRDITLNNILCFPDGCVKVTDFGISRRVVPEVEVATTLVGFPSSIPPELLREGIWTLQSDIYQLGIVLLTLMLGREPIPYGASFDEIQAKILDGHPRQIAESLVPQYGALAEVVKYMVCRTRAFRYGSAAQVSSELLAVRQNILQSN